MLGKVNNACFVHDRMSLKVVIQYLAKGCFHSP